MNWEKIQGNWKILKGKAKEQWSKLSDDQLTSSEGKRDQLNGHIQKAYGIGKEEAEKQITAWTQKAEQQKWCDDGGSQAKPTDNMKASDHAKTSDSVKPGVQQAKPAAQQPKP